MVWRRRGEEMMRVQLVEIWLVGHAWREVIRGWGFFSDFSIELPKVHTVLITKKTNMRCKQRMRQ